MAEEEGIVKKYRKKYEKQEATFALFTPFFVSVGAGNLDLQSFDHCISQDFYFLQALLQAFRMAEDWADREAYKEPIRSLKEFVHKMIRTYKTTVLENPKVSGIDSTTDNYLDFLVSTASGKFEGDYIREKRNTIAAYTLAAIAPFMRLYVHLSHRILQDLNNTSDNIYKKWLQYYCSQEIQDLAKETEDALDKLGASLTKEELPFAEKLYHQAMKLQVQFFASLSVSQPTVVPYNSVQDLNKSPLAIFSNVNLTCIVFQDRSSVKCLKTELFDITTEYGRELKHYLESVMASHPAISQFDYNGFSIALEQVEELKRKRNEKMEDSLVMKDLSLDMIQTAIPELRLFDNCREFFQKTVTIAKFPRIDLHVVSHFHYGDFIRKLFPSDQLDYTKDSVTTGKIIKAGSPFDKFHVFPEVQKVYIGGKVEDLLSLVQADIGIVLGSSKILWKLGEHFGISFVPLLNGVVKNQMGLGDWKPKSGILYTVDSWAEIQAFILGL
ncbi:heme oxygenase [Trema orientale]|uniref:Heme oxygenase n=1 Tax=Trema orientale TaxID=63057 RepID=A0A2P5AIL6_TREOI|nr:heme oxygenase [Trema orientale]